MKTLEYKEFRRGNTGDRDKFVASEKDPEHQSRHAEITHEAMIGKNKSGIGELVGPKTELDSWLR